MKIDLIEIRKHLHKNPELSGKEEETSKKIIQILKQFSPDEVIANIGGFGVAAVFKLVHDKQKCPTIMFRAELDALPITEANHFDHKSSHLGVSHKCGHDGHMTILLGLAEKIKQQNLKANIILLFQPAEETAEGAKCIIKDPKFKALKPDYIFALHNLPGFIEGSIIIRKGILTSNSIGLKVNFLGETSHAGHPENGNNPVLAMTNLIQSLMVIPQLHTRLEEAALVTIIHAKLGEIAFGTSPEEADVMATFRSHKNKTMEIMKAKAITLVEKIAQTYSLDYKIEWVEYFPEIINDNECVDIVFRAAKKLKKRVIALPRPFTWTEDFSYFTKKYKGAFLGLGAGKDLPQLHNSDYDFPDKITEDGVNIFFQIIKELCGSTL